jgi:hypothetical protein
LESQRQEFCAKLVIYARLASSALPADGVADAREIGDYIMRDTSDKALVATVGGYVVRPLYEHGAGRARLSASESGTA